MIYNLWAYAFFFSYYCLETEIKLTVVWTQQKQETYIKQSQENELESQTSDDHENHAPTGGHVTRMKVATAESMSRVTPKASGYSEHQKMMNRGR
jgi:hypothetical protein